MRSCEYIFITSSRFWSETLSNHSLFVLLLFSGHVCLLIHFSFSCSFTTSFRRFIYRSTSHLELWCLRCFGLRWRNRLLDLFQTSRLSRRRVEPIGRRRFPKEVTCRCQFVRFSLLFFRFCSWIPVHQKITQNPLLLSMFTICNAYFGHLVTNQCLSSWEFFIEKWELARGYILPLESSSSL